MTKMEKVIKGTEICLSGGAPDRCRECPYDREGCDRQRMQDTLELLKEQVETSIKLYRILDDTCKRVRESTEEDYVCGLCQYDGAYKTDSGDWANECPGFDSSDCFCMKNEIREMCGMELLPEQE